MTIRLFYQIMCYSDRLTNSIKSYQIISIIKTSIKTKLSHQNQNLLYLDLDNFFHLIVKTLKRMTDLVYWSTFLLTFFRKYML